MRVLITGASGLLGSYLMKTAAPGDEVLGTFCTLGGGNLRRMDILQGREIYQVLNDFQPDTIIHCAGEGRVDYCENAPHDAGRVIVQGANRLLMAAEDLGCHFVYISSNAVYAGDEPPYHEQSPRCPVNKYGSLKRDAERLLPYYPYRTTLIRPILLYGWPGPGKRNNFVTRILEQLAMKDLKSWGQIPVADDIFTQPTYAGDCAEAIWAATRAQVDVLNVAPREKMSLFKFAVEVAKAFDLDADLLTPVPAAEMKSLAPRPRDTTFDVSKAERLGLHLSPPAEGMRKMRRERE